MQKKTVEWLIRLQRVPTAEHKVDDDDDDEIESQIIVFYYLAIADTTQRDARLATESDTAMSAR